VAPTALAPYVLSLTVTITLSLPQRRLLTVEASQSILRDSVLSLCCLGDTRKRRLAHARARPLALFLPLPDLPPLTAPATNGMHARSPAGRYTFQFQSRCSVCVFLFSLFGKVLRLLMGEGLRESRDGAPPAC
ncbi:hypothetical protein NDU88_005593, partial [Pleurodeles waltl]